MTPELYYFVKIFQEIYTLFYFEVQIFGYEFRIIDFILFNAIGHFLIDTLEDVYTRGRDNG